MNARNCWERDMKKLTKIAGAFVLVGLLFGSVACGGSAKEADDASQAEEGEPKKGLEKFEGNRMERAEEEE